jgi:hypothetical protein
MHFGLGFNDQDQSSMAARPLLSEGLAEAAVFDLISKDKTDDQDGSTNDD